MKPKGRRRAEPRAQAATDIHEDWAAVKGSKHPPYGYIVKWEYPTAIVIFKMAILGKRRLSHGVVYKARYVGIFFKTPGLKIDKFDLPSGEAYDRHVISFTQEEVARHIEYNRRHHIDRLFHEMRRFNSAMEEVARQLKSTEEFLLHVREDPIPGYVLEGLPKKESKRLT